MIRDQSRYIYAALHEITVHLVLGSLLACGVVFLFIGFLVSIEVFREIRVPFTSIRLATRRRESTEAADTATAVDRRPRAANAATTSLGDAGPEARPTR